MKIDNILLLSLVFIGAALLPACTEAPKETATKAPIILKKDAHSFSEPEKVIIENMHLDLEADFEKQILTGSVKLGINNHAGTDKLILDTKELIVTAVTLDDGNSTQFIFGDKVDHMGTPMIIDIAPATKSVTIEYSTSPGAPALQWLSPEQTRGGVHPFLFTQSQAILARSWIPCQDSPGVKYTYTANIKVPKDLIAVMSAENGTSKSEDGNYSFTMPQPVPSYLMALSVGDIAYKSLGKTAGVYAEPDFLDACANEFADVQVMIEKSEELYGAYRWGQYDIIVLPPSFPFGGMENPRLTFATPTIIAGDRSLVALVAHELAHSWSGNLVTNATWDDFWLNEGFTVYFENRIMEKVYGREYSEMLEQLGLQDLHKTIHELGEDNEDTKLLLDLDGRDPDEGLTDIAYEKGRFFLKSVEIAVGREKFDAFLNKYFDEFAFGTQTTEGFIDYMQKELIQGDPELSEKINFNDWIFGTGLPDNCPKPASKEFEKVEAQIAAFMEGSNPEELETEGWTTHHWLHFLRNLPKELDGAQMTSLDKAFNFTKNGNNEILCVWYQKAIDNSYKVAYPEIERFLIAVGRRKFLTPIYKKLAATDEGLAFAKEIYVKARPGYHSVSYNTIDEVLGIN